jgi:hypothetical protein
MINFIFFPVRRLLLRTLSFKVLHKKKSREFRGDEQEHNPLLIIL